MTRTDDIHILVNGETVLLDKSGALFCVAHGTLVFADLHFEKGSSFARRGVLLPPYDTRATIARMEEAIARHAPVRVIALGDSFHDGDAADRLDDEDCAALKRLTARVEWIWIEGNHDPKPPDWLGGVIADEIALGGLVLRHLPGARGQVGEVAGHLHPATTVSGRGMSVRRRCFVSDGMRLLMPAFGAYAGGLDVREAAIASLFADRFGVYALGRDRVYAVAQPMRRKTRDEIQPSSIASRTVKSP